MTHHITWDHRDCEHEHGHCNPQGKASCDDPECFHRSMCKGHCEEITECDGCEAQPEFFQHADPGVRHDNSGHPLAYGTECNAVLFLDWSDDIAEDYEGPEEVTPRRDAPIEVTWNGDWYEWHYLDMLTQAAPCSTIEA